MRRLIWLLAIVLAIVALGLLTACPKRTPYKQAYKPAAGERPGPATQAEAGKLVSGKAPATVEGAETQRTEPGEATQETAEPGAEAEGEQEPADTTEEGGEAAAGEAETGAPEQPPAPQPKPTPTFVPASELETRMNEVIDVGFETKYGTFMIAVYPEIAPVSAKHFLDLVRAGFYDGMVIHRVEPGFVVQMGRITDENSPNYHYTQEPIKDERNCSENMPFTVAFAKRYEQGQKVEDSATTQFFINLGDNRKLDPDFTVMGKVIHGGKVVTSLSVGDRIGRAYILEEGAELNLERETGN